MEPRGFSPGVRSRRVTPEGGELESDGLERPSRTRSCYHVVMHDGMLYRTQIQLTRAQVTALKSVAARRGASMAAVIREVVDELVARGASSGEDRTRARALAAVGRFRSGRRDVSRRHDAYLAEAIER